MEPLVLVLAPQWVWLCASCLQETGRTALRVAVPRPLPLWGTTKAQLSKPK